MDGLTIVTGGGGFIGSHLVSQLVDSGRVVRVVERPGAAVDHLPPGVELVFADIRESHRARQRQWREADGSITWRRIRTSGSAIATSSTR